MIVEQMTNANNTGWQKGGVTTRVVSVKERMLCM